MTSQPFLSRRDFLRQALCAGTGLLASCTQRTGSPAPTASPPPNPATATGQAPSPAAGLIKNIIILLQENHSFDNLFAGFPGAESQSAGQACPDQLPSDPPHQHADALVVDGATTAAARCSYAEADAPSYWKIARAFTLCDRFFSDVRGPSHPNYLMLLAAQSPIVNTPPHDACPDFCLDLPTIVDRLDPQGLTWRDYGGILTEFRALIGRPEIIALDDRQFFADARAGTMPNVTWLNAGFLSGPDKSGHPPNSLCVGENYAVRVLNAVMQSPQWNSTALFLVWDDWGGFYDHVEPPVVETWHDGTPFRYGHRVPCIVVSPYARQGHVSHTRYSHVSLLRFIETIFNLEPLTERDAGANDLLDCFDFTQPPRPPIAFTERACA